jgi:hypothetical protein
VAFADEIAAAVWRVHWIKVSATHLCPNARP